MFEKLDVKDMISLAEKSKEQTILQTCEQIERKIRTAADLGYRFIELEWPLCLHSRDKQRICEALVIKGFTVGPTYSWVAWE